MKKKFFHALFGICFVVFVAGSTSCGGPNNVSGAQSDPKADVAAAKKALEIGLNASDTLDRVTQNFTLPSTVGNGVTVTWTSSDSAVITVDGTVTRSGENKPVTLTALLKKEKESATKEFKLTVLGIDQEEVDKALKQLPQPNPVIYGTVGHLYLSSVGQGVTATWTAEPAGIIDTKTGMVTKPTSKTDVTLTVTLKKGVGKAVKSYKITVYPEGVTPSADDLLATLNVPANAEDDFDLTTSFGMTQVHWTSSDEKVITVRYGKAEVTRDLVDRKVTLTAKITEGGSSKQKDFPVAVKAISKISNSYRSYEFKDNLLILMEHDRSGREYRIIKRDDQVRTITVQLQRVYQQGSWYSVDEAMQKEIQEMNDWIDKELNAYSQLEALPVVTKEKLRAIFNFGYEGQQLSDEEFYDRVLRRYIFEMSYEEFQRLTDEELTQKTKERLSFIKKERCEMFGVAEGSTWQQIAEAQKKQESQIVNAEAEEAKKPQTYTYRVRKSGDGYSLETYTIYNPEKVWFQQKGDYHSDPSAEKNMAIYIWREGRGSLHMRPTSSSNETRYEIVCQPDGTSFTAKEEGNSSALELQGMVKDHKDGTITVTFGGDSYKLHYRGNSL